MDKNNQEKFNEQSKPKKNQESNLIRARKAFLKENYSDTAAENFSDKPDDYINIIRTGGGKPKTINYEDIRESNEGNDYDDSLLYTEGDVSEHVEHESGVKYELNPIQAEVLSGVKNKTVAQKVLKLLNGGSLEVKPGDKHEALLSAEAFQLFEDVKKLEDSRIAESNLEGGNLTRSKETGSDKLKQERTKSFAKYLADKYPDSEVNLSHIMGENNQAWHDLNEDEILKMVSEIQSEKKKKGEDVQLFDEKKMREMDYIEQGGHTYAKLPSDEEFNQYEEWKKGKNNQSFEENMAPIQLDKKSLMERRFKKPKDFVVYLKEKYPNEEITEGLIMNTQRVENYSHLDMDEIIREASALENKSVEQDSVIQQKQKSQERGESKEVKKASREKLMKRLSFMDYVEKGVHTIAGEEIPNENKMHEIWKEQVKQIGEIIKSFDNEQIKIKLENGLKGYLTTGKFDNFTRKENARYLVAETVLQSPINFEDMISSIKSIQEGVSNSGFELKKKLSMKKLIELVETEGTLEGKSAEEIVQTLKAYQNGEVTIDAISRLNNIGGINGGLRAIVKEYVNISETSQESNDQAIDKEEEKRRSLSNPRTKRAKEKSKKGWKFWKK